MSQHRSYDTRRRVKAVKKAQGDLTSRFLFAGSFSKTEVKTTCVADVGTAEDSRRKLRRGGKILLSEEGKLRGSTVKLP
ncbi:hypothetical protein GJAV_G00164690 [Gymnothorax javanicus]|nr:hypothetical protein GJAV_G00164690 [Gymnothorax javanicus]